MCVPVKSGKRLSPARKSTPSFCITRCTSSLKKFCDVNKYPRPDKATHFTARSYSCGVIPTKLFDITFSMSSAVNGLRTKFIRLECALISIFTKRPLLSLFYKKVNLEQKYNYIINVVFYSQQRCDKSIRRAHTQVMEVVLVAETSLWKHWKRSKLFIFIWLKADTNVGIR